MEHEVPTDCDSIKIEDSFFPHSLFFFIFGILVKNTKKSKNYSAFFFIFIHLFEFERERERQGGVFSEAAFVVVVFPLFLIRIDTPLSRLLILGYAYWNQEHGKEKNK